MARLNPAFDQVRAQILSREKMSFLNEVFFIVRREEHRRVTMFNDHNLEGSAMCLTRKKDHGLRHSKEEMCFPLRKIKRACGVPTIRSQNTQERHPLNCMKKRLF